MVNPVEQPSRGFAMNDNLFQNFRYRLAAMLLPVFICIITTSNAATTIGGELASTTFTSAGNPYIVEKEIVIPANETVTIEEGCRLYFAPFTGIVVEGTLTVAGAQEQPVLFTSINEQPSTEPVKQLPNPFDWNGIYIKPTAKAVSLSDFSISYSVYGIKSQKSDISITNGVFRQNGQYHCTVNESVLQVADGIPFTYVTHSVTYDPNGSDEGTAPVDNQRYVAGMVVKVPENSGSLVVKGRSFCCWNSSPDGNGTDYVPGAAFVIGENDVMLYAKWVGAKQTRRATAKTQSPVSGNQLILPVVLTGSGMISGGFSLYFLSRWVSGKETFLETPDAGKRQQLSDKGKTYSFASIATGIIGMGVVTSGIVLYVRYSGLNNSSLSLQPQIFGESAGVSLTINLR